LGGEALAPGPARRAPEFPPAIAAAVYESRELGVRDRRLGNPERRDLDLVGPLLVVEDEAIGGGRADPPPPAGHLDAASPRTPPPLLECVAPRPRLPVRANPSACREKTSASTCISSCRIERS